MELEKLLYGVETTLYVDDRGDKGKIYLGRGLPKRETKKNLLMTVFQVKGGYWVADMTAVMVAGFTASLACGGG